MATPKKKSITPQWSVQFEIHPSPSINLHEHIAFTHRWWKGLIWMAGVWPKYSNIIVDRTGITYTFRRVTARSQGMDTPFPTESLLLVETPGNVVICTESSLWNYGRRLMAEGRYGRNLWDSYLNYLTEFSLVTYSREDWDRLQAEGHVTLING